MISWDLEAVETGSFQAYLSLLTQGTAGEAAAAAGRGVPGTSISGPPPSGLIDIVSGAAARAAGDSN